MFNGGNSKYTHWYKNPYPSINPIKSTNLISQLEKLGNVILHNPIFNFDSNDIDKFSKSKKDYMFKLSDLDMVQHCKKLYKKINSNNKFISISYSRGYLLATIFASIYPNQVLGYINLDKKLNAEGAKNYINEIPNYSTITNKDLKKLFTDLKNNNTIENRNKLADIVKYFMYSQYIKINYKFDSIPVYIFNNIYNDKEINLLMQDYIKKTLEPKITYNNELSKLNPNVISIYYVGLTHWFYFGKETDIIDVVKKILGWRLCK